MGHDKTRSSVSIGEVDWSSPQLSDLLKKADGWNIDQRSHLHPQEVQIRITCGWSAGDASESALLIAEIDGAMVLATRIPLPHGVEVEVSCQTGGNLRTRSGVVVEEREGQRAEDRQQGLFLNWVRIRSR